MRKAVSMPAARLLRRRSTPLPSPSLMSHSARSTSPRASRRGLGGGAGLVRRVAAGERCGKQLAQRGFVVDDEYLHGFSLFLP